jgi:carbon starvation protein
VCVAGWGYFLYQGVVDPLGGINTLWPLFGIANQMLAAIALTLSCVVLVKMKRERYLWIPALPTVWLVACTLTAGSQKVFGADPRVSFVAHARKFAAAAAEGKVLAPAKSVADMNQVIFNDYLDAGLTVLFMLVVLATLGFGIRSALKARASAEPTAHESPRVPLSSVGS